MSDRVHKARTEVTLAMQAYSLALRYEKQTIQEWDAVQRKVDALIAAVEARERARPAEGTGEAVARLVDAINWACGADDSDFQEPPNAKRYWWRRELHFRAGLTYDAAQGRYVLAHPPRPVVTEAAIANARRLADIALHVMRTSLHGNANAMEYVERCLQEITAALAARPEGE